MQDYQSGEVIFFRFSAFLPKLVLVSKICLISLVLVEVEVMSVVVSLSNIGQPDRFQSECPEKSFDQLFVGG